ncbi:hypothetical protein [Helicobacter sp. 23-1045]
MFKKIFCDYSKVWMDFGAESYLDSAKFVFDSQNLMRQILSLRDFAILERDSANFGLKRRICVIFRHCEKSHFERLRGNPNKIVILSEAKNLLFVSQNLMRQISSLRDLPKANRGNPLWRLCVLGESPTCNESALICFWIDLLFLLDSAIFVRFAESARFSPLCPFDSLIFLAKWLHPPPRSPYSPKAATFRF